MNIEIHPDFINRLKNIDWFSNLLGDNKPSNVQLHHFYVSSWEEAKQLHSMIGWDNVGIDAGNQISIYVGGHFPHLFAKKWNKLAVAANKEVDGLITSALKRITAEHDLDKRFSDFVRWNVGKMVMEDAYRDTHPPIFFTSELLPFYEAGRLPCGYINGDWPNGCLAVI